MDKINKSKAWELVFKVVQVIKDDEMLRDDYEEIVCNCESIIEEFHGDEMVDYVITKVDRIILIYKDLGIWDYVTVLNDKELQKSPPLS